MSIYNVQDHPVIRNMERSGSPDGKAPVYPRCPVCGKEPEIFYFDRSREIIGCCDCVTAREYFEIEPMATEEYDV